MNSQKILLLTALSLGVTALGCGGEEGSNDKTGYTCNCGPDQICDTTTGTCVGCLTNAHCSAPTTICRTNDHVCVECVTQSDCAGDMVCNMGKCEGGAEAEECGLSKPCTGQGEYCSSEGICVKDVQCTQENQATTCPGSTCTEEGTCLNSKKVTCDGSKTPANATVVSDLVNIAWTASSGWTKASECEWFCNDGYQINAAGNACENAPECTQENAATVCPVSECTANGTCLTSKKVSCDKSKTPAHALAVEAQETISWTVSTGWSDPAACAWNCVSGYVINAKKDGCDVAPECTENTDCAPNGECNEGSCLSSKNVPCLQPAGVLPNGASYVVKDVTVTWSAGSGWTRAETCEWRCNSPFINEGNKCVEPPECTTNAQCNPGGECVNNACLTSKEVACTQSGKPANSSYTTGNVTITWTAGKGWTEPAKCGWKCNSGFETSGDGKSCVAIETCTPGTCTDSIYCTDTKTERDCSALSTQKLCLDGEGCVQCIDNGDCVTGKYCKQDTHRCNDVSCTGCKSTYETCDKSNPTSDGKGQCIPATCNKTQCTNNYACIGGVYTFCENGCANNACKPAAVGCATQANPDDWCLMESSGAVCEISSGNCVDCLKDSDCGNGKECNLATKTCQKKCGNGKLDAGEECEANISTSQWTKNCGSFSWDGGYGHHLTLVGNVTCTDECKVDESTCTTCGNNSVDDGSAGITLDGKPEECDPAVADKTKWDFASCAEVNSTTTGDVSCNNDCTINIDACKDNGDPCNGLKADEECTSYMSAGGPTILCSTHFAEYISEGMFDPNQTVSESAHIVCKNASETCSAKKVVDEDATWNACVIEQQPVKVGWCSVYPVYGENYGVELDDAHRTKTLYAKVNVAGETGNNGTHSSALQGKLLIYTDKTDKTDKLDLVTEIPATRNVGYSNNANDEWQATISTSDFPADDMYYYEWQFTGDNGTSWYGCKNACDGSDCAYLGQNYNEDYLIMVTKPASKTYSTDFEWITKIDTGYTVTENITADGITWSFIGRTDTKNGTTADYTISGRGVVLRNSSTYISAQGMNGVSEISFQYKYWKKPEIKVCTKANESDANCLEEVTAEMSHTDTSTEPGLGLATFTSTSAAARYAKIYVKGTNNLQIILDNVEVKE